MSDRLSLSVSHCLAICEDLGLEPNYVHSIVMRPTDGHVVVYKLNEDGEKYVDLDLGEAATEVIEFDVIQLVSA